MKMKQKTALFTTALLSISMLLTACSSNTASNKPVKDTEILSQSRSAYYSKDYQKALELLEPLAQKGNTKAQLQLGAMYFSGQGVTQDYSQALQWFQKAAEVGDLDAQNLLAGLYYEGKGVKKDLKEVRKWLTKACDAGHQISCEDLKALDKSVRKK